LLKGKADKVKAKINKQSEKLGELAAKRYAETEASA
jgi:hypothetical protein